MKNRQMLSVLSLTVLCAMAFTATAVFAQGFNLQETQRRIAEKTRLINQHCPADAMVAAVNAYVDAVEAVDEAQDDYDAALASTSLLRPMFIFAAAINLAAAKATAAQRLTEARDAVDARSACIDSIDFSGIQ